LRMVLLNGYYTTSEKIKEADTIMWVHGLCSEIIGIEQPSHKHTIPLMCSLPQSRLGSTW
jgi:hypothetical protein